MPLIASLRRGLAPSSRALLARPTAAVIVTSPFRPQSRSFPTGELAADANFILNSKEHAEGGGRNELHYAQTEDTVAEVVRRTNRGRHLISPLARVSDETTVACSLAVCSAVVAAHAAVPSYVHAARPPQSHPCLSPRFLQVREMKKRSIGALIVKDANDGVAGIVTSDQVVSNRES